MGKSVKHKKLLARAGQKPFDGSITAPIASILFTHVNITEERKSTLTDKNRARLLSTKTEAKIRLYKSYITLVFQNSR